MRILKNKYFARFMKDTGISDIDLRQAVRQAEKGLIDADLGGGLLKQRIARPNQGKSSGFRTILVQGGVNNPIVKQVRYTEHNHKV